jgi:aspartate 1-decarboxylase
MTQCEKDESFMKLNVFKSKLHRAVVTHADVAYEGSVTIDKALMKAANIAPYEAVHIWNVTRGTRLVTYALEGPAGSGIVCVNGAAAHLNEPGDRVILATFAEMTPEELATFKPTVVLLDENNKIVEMNRTEQPGPKTDTLVA